MPKSDNRNQNKPFQKGEAPEFDQKIIDLARVTRVMAGGKRMRFRACVAIGNKKGEFGVGLAKGADVSISVNKAVNKAKKNLIKVPLINETIPHVVVVKVGAARLLLKPAPRGTGIKAGGAVRVALELAGVPNVVAKIFGTSNKINNIQALIAAVLKLKKVGKSPKAPKEVKKAEGEEVTAVKAKSFAKKTEKVVENKEIAK